MLKDVAEETQQKKHTHSIYAQYSQVNMDAHESVELPEAVERLASEGIRQRGGFGIVGSVKPEITRS